MAELFRFSVTLMLTHLLHLEIIQVHAILEKNNWLSPLSTTTKCPRYILRRSVLLLKSIPRVKQPTVCRLRTVNTFSITYFYNKILFLFYWINTQNFKHNHRKIKIYCEKGEFHFLALKVSSIPKTTTTKNSPQIKKIK